MMLDHDHLEDRPLPHPVLLRLTSGELPLQSPIAALPTRSPRQRLSHYRLDRLPAESAYSDLPEKPQHKRQTGLGRTLRRVRQSPIRARSHHLYASDPSGQPVGGQHRPAESVAEASRSLPSSPTVPNRLPPQPTSLIGRAEDVASLTALVSTHHGRLITLCGPGGVGKTRLAIALAENMREHFGGGVWFVDLTSLSDHALVIPTIARELSVREEAGRDPFAALATSLPDRALLLLDNLEHLPGAASAIDALLAACPGLTVIATSREPLRLRREQVFQVRPLPVPSGRRASWNVPTLATIPAVEFFVDRAKAADMTFTLTAENAEAVAELMRHLDGLPLAVELAAARTRLLDPAALLAWVDHGLALLRWDTPDLPPRHRTLRATLDWSYALLSAEEQAVFRRLGVFAGSFSLDAVTSVSDTEEFGVDALDILTSLIDKQLVRVLEGFGSEPRFGQLVTVREYAWEQLQANDDVTSIRDRHLAYYLELAEEAARAMLGPDEELWLSRLDREVDNLRLAQEWAITRGDVNAEGHLAAALTLFWIFRGYLREGSQRIEAALSRSHDADPVLHARLLGVAGNVAEWSGHEGRAIAHFEASLATAQAAGDGALAANALGHLAKLAYSRGDATSAQKLAREMLTLARAVDSGWAIGLAYTYLVGFAIGPHGTSRDRERVLRELDDPLTRLRAVGGHRALAVVLAGQARLLIKSDRPAALAALGEALQVARGNDDPVIISLVPWLAVVLLAEHLAHEQVVRLSGAIAALEERAAAIGGRTLISLYGSPQDRAAIAQAIAAARSTLGEDAFATADAAGRVLTFTALIDEMLAVLQELEPLISARTLHLGRWQQTADLISPRERDVLVLLAQGQTNKAIADALFVAPSTIKTHVTSLLTKLNADNRAHLATIAVRRELLAI